MSPVSRGRAKKKSGKKKKNRSGAGKAGSRAEVMSAQLSAAAGVASALTANASLPGPLEARDQARSWWPDSHAEVLADARVLLACESPADLEDVVCDLLGQHWSWLFDEHERGLAMEEWLEALIEATKPDAADPIVRRLLYGIAAIATPGLAGFAVQVLRGTAPSTAEPEWLPRTHRAVASPDVLLLRDGYGLRFGLLVEMTGPNRPSRIYLLDVDLCHGMDQVLSSGYHPDVDTAAAAWRALVGPSADGCEPTPADPELLPVVVPGGGVLDEFYGRPLTPSQFAERYRGDHIVHAVAEALREAGRPIHWDHESPGHSAARAEALAKEFRSWAEAAEVELPQDELVEDLLDEWVTGLPGDLPLCCSPHRIAAFTAYLVDGWIKDHRDAAVALLEPLARYCIERTGLPTPLAEHTLAWARRAALEPEDVGGDLGNNLNRPICETCVESPYLAGLADGTTTP